MKCLRFKYGRENVFSRAEFIFVIKSKERWRHLLGVCELVEWTALSALHLSDGRASRITICSQLSNVRIGSHTPVHYTSVLAVLQKLDEKKTNRNKL